MPLRWTKTEKWKDKWFRELKPKHKLLWLYLIDNCDISGILDWDVNLWKREIGFSIDENEIKEIFAGRILFIPNTDKCWIPKFIKTQQRCKIEELKESNPAHRGILKTIQNYNLIELLRSYEGSTKGLPSPYSNSTSTGTSKGKGTSTKIEEKKITYENGKLEISPELLEEFYAEFGREHVNNRIPEMERWLKFNKPKKDYKRFIFNWINRGDKFDGKPISSVAAEHRKYAKVTSRSQ